MQRFQSFRSKNSYVNVIHSVTRLLLCGALLMVQRKIFRTAHLEQARSRAVEFEAFGAAALQQQLLRHRRRGNVKPHGMIVERIDHNDEPLDLVPPFRPEQGNVIDEDRIETLGDGQKSTAPSGLSQRSAKENRAMRSTASGTWMWRPFIGISSGWALRPCSACVQTHPSPCRYAR